MVKVALASAPGVLGDLLESIIERDPGFQLTMHTEDLGDLARLAQDSDLEAMILSTQPSPTPRLAQRLLSAGTCRAVVIISSDGKDASLFAPRRRPVRLGDLSPDRLLSWIQEAVSTDAGGDDA